MNKAEGPLERLLDVVRRVARNQPDATRQLEAIAGDSDSPAMIADLADQINHIVVQKEAREYRLELMIEDLLHAQAALVEARHDPLTGLPNRGLFHDLLAQACLTAERQGHSLALMFVDLDRFKQVNDTLGHDAGDELLVQVSHRLKGCVRESDLVARLGGDEFALALPMLTDRETAVDIARQIVETLHTRFVLAMGEAEIGASIGISFLPDHGTRAVSLLKNADVAMYHAKESGRDTFRLYECSMVK